MEVARDNVGQYGSFVILFRQGEGGGMRYTTLFMTGQRRKIAGVRARAEYIAKILSEEKKNRIGETRRMPQASLRETKRDKQLRALSRLNCYVSDTICFRRKPPFEGGRCERVRLFFASMCSMFL